MKAEKWKGQIVTIPNETARFLTWEELGIRVVRPCPNCGGVTPWWWEHDIKECYRNQIYRSLLR